MEGWLYDDIVEDILPLEVTNMYVKLDRAWVLPSAKNIEVRKIPSKPLLTKILFKVFFKICSTHFLRLHFEYF